MLLDPHDNMPSRVLNAILTHQPAQMVDRMVDHWQRHCKDSITWILYGGAKEQFEAIQFDNKTFVDDPRLRTKDHPRERQSYRGCFEQLISSTSHLDHQFILFTEFDQIPLVNNFNERLLERLASEDADALFHGLRRIDGSNHPHLLAHIADPAFFRFFQNFSVRDDMAILSAWGFGQFWRRTCFEEILNHPDGIGNYPKIYLELWGPTVAHHLGYRLRNLSDQEPFNHFNQRPAPHWNHLAQLGAWFAHPYKDAWNLPTQAQ